MTAATTSPEVTTRPATGRITWTTVDRGFSVASRDGEYIGCVDEVASGFVVRDSRNVTVGRFGTIDGARDALRLAIEGDGADADETDDPWRRAAAVSAVVAGGVLLTAGMLAPWL